MTGQPLILDHNGNPVPRSVRRSKKYGPAQVLYECAVCLVPYKLNRGVMRADCNCTVNGEDNEPEPNAVRAMLGGIAGWMGL